MAYQRFLTNKDYRAVLTDEQFEMLVNGDANRLSQAERSAEMNFLEYLDQHYEIERVFRVGKCIRDYHVGVTYPANVHFKKDGMVYKTLKAIAGCKKPPSTVYWGQLTELFAIPDIDRKPKYSQLHTYGIGDIVRFGTEWWVCKAPNGYELDNIQLPGVEYWKKVEVTEWQPNMEWGLHQVCVYGLVYYVKNSVGESESDEVLTPETDDTWSQIAEYSSEYNYEVGKNDYVVLGNEVFEPKISPNADEVVVGENVIVDDPRNPNVITHMTNIACYYLHQMISPTNISEVRRLAYEDSMQWLSNAARFKINPKLPRKHDCEEGGAVVDFALETYQREFDPSHDMWLI